MATEQGRHGTPAAHDTRREPSSFRDPGSTVFYADGMVLRGLRPAAVDDWRALAASTFFPQWQRDGRICRTEPAGPEQTSQHSEWSLVLQHERVPFVSYPYEWTFGMVRDAASLHLEMLLAAVPDGIITKDGSAYNIQWHGSDPVFIDIGSFTQLRDGEPWAGYGQFCQTLLYPLMLRAHLGLSFQPWLRGQVDGIQPHQMRQLFGGMKRFRAGVLKNVHLHGAMQARHAGTSANSVRDELRDAGYSRELTVATLRALAKLVHRLDRPPRDSGWTDYQQTCSYSDDDRAAKKAFVAKALADRAPSLVVDLGANDGTYSRIAAEHARYVVAVEADEHTADVLYRTLRAERERRILTLVMDLADPSPGIGWRGHERASFAARAKPDAVLALAVLHHLAIGRNVPLGDLVDWLAGMGGRVVVEFVDPTDPMAKRLLGNKPEGLFPDYRRDVFERLLAARFAIVSREELPSGTRTLYVGDPLD